MKRLMKLWNAILFRIDNMANEYETRRSLSCKAKYIAESERLYRIVKIDGKARIVIANRPASCESDESKLMERLFELREQYVNECVNKKQVI